MEQYYEIVGSGRLADVAALLTGDVKPTFADAKPVTGREAATASIRFVLDETTKIEHKVVHCIEPRPLVDGVAEVLFGIRIRYWLKSGEEVDIPGAVYARVNADNRFTEQRLYGDLDGDLAEVFGG